MTEYKIVDPATNVLVRRYPTSDDATVDRAVEAAAAEFTAWRRRPVEERADAVLAVSREFENRREELAAIVTREMGKTTREALGEVDLSAAIFAYYAEYGPDLAADQRLDIHGGDDVVVRSEPLGVLLGVMPWNYPYYQVARFAAPNLVLGNTVVLKHAPNCPESAQAIEDIMRAAGLPAGAYINVYATNQQVARVIADPRVQGCRSRARSGPGERWARSRAATSRSTSSSSAAPTPSLSFPTQTWRPPSPRPSRAGWATRARRAPPRSGS